MTKLFKNIVCKLTAAVLAAVMLPLFAVDAAAAGSKEFWTVDRSAPAADDCTGWVGNGSTDFSVDADTHYKNSRYSIKITNKDYNVSYVEKTFEVEPKTTYKFSAMVKYSGYKISPDVKSKKSGACIGKAFTYDSSDFVTSNKWTKAEYTFTTGDETEYKLCLQNGMFNGDCKGTAWFSDVKLEKAELTNEWTVLAIVYKNVNAKVTLNGKKSVFKDSIDKDMEKKIKKSLNATKKSLKTFSKGKMSIKEIDYVTVDTPVTKLADYKYSGDKWGTQEINSYMLDQNESYVTDVADKYLEKKTYNQIIAFAPLGHCGWGGLGGSYKNAGFAQINCYEYAFYSKDFPEEALVHEIGHYVESKSRNINEKKTVYLHSAPDYGYKTSSREWYSVYMSATLPGNKGIDPDAYKVLSGNYTLVSDDMTTGTGIKQSSSFPISLSELKVKPIADRTYNKKAQKPDAVITDGKYTLKRGIDYVINYKNNTSVGKATAVITGKGIYTGKITTEFNIVSKSSAPTFKAKKSGGKIKLSWSKIEGAGTYIIWVSKDGKDYKKLSELSSDEFSMSVKYSSGHTYRFAFTAYLTESGTYIPYIYSDTI